MSGRPCSTDARVIVPLCGSSSIATGNAVAQLVGDDVVARALRPGDAARFARAGIAFGQRDRSLTGIGDPPTHGRGRLFRRWRTRPRGRAARAHRRWRRDRQQRGDECGDDDGRAHAQNRRRRISAAPTSVPMLVPMVVSRNTRQMRNSRFCHHCRGMRTSSVTL